MFYYIELPITVRKLHLAAIKIPPAPEGAGGTWPLRGSNIPLMVSEMTAPTSPVTVLIIVVVLIMIPVLIVGHVAMMLERPDLHLDDL